MRESVPLWVCWATCLIYWVYNLMTEENTIECYDKKFHNNKWTCWSIYSLFNLGNEEFFTKLSRTAILFLNFIWQGTVLAAIYS